MQNNKNLVFACIQGEKLQSLNQEKIDENSLIFLYRTYYFGKRHDMKECTSFKKHFLKNTCNLGHSNQQR